MARTIGLDVGDSRIGVAISDPLGIIASPLTIIDRSNPAVDIEAVAAIAREQNAEGIVVGLPVSMDGNQGTQAEKTREFTAALSRSTDIPVSFQDERLSTVQAKRMAKEAGKTSRGVRYDATAAALILQAYLDANSGSPGFEYP